MHTIDISVQISIRFLRIYLLYDRIIGSRCVILDAICGLQWPLAFGCDTVVRLIVSKDSPVHVPDKDKIQSWEELQRLTDLLVRQRPVLILTGGRSQFPPAYSIEEK